MNASPLISIVVPSYNQGRYLRETLQSLVDQNYPNLEVIIQDGGSTDGAVAIAEEFVGRDPEVFKLFVEKDSGQADALNRGFARTRGEILGFLNSDDTLYPGCLQRVAREIDPDRNRWIVMGRCLFTGESSAYVGVEHPASFISHFEQLAIWKRGYNSIPQPSVFWHRRVWEQCGGFDATENHVLDYDLFCRFSRRFRFHQVDELWSTYRMHPVSKSAQRTEPEILELSIKVSRRYWGSWFSPLRWRCELSYGSYQRHSHEKGRHHARRCEEAAEAGQRIRTVIEFMITLWHSPKMARDRLLVPFAAAKRLRLLQRLLIDRAGRFTGLYEADRWVGPVYRQDLEVPKNAGRLVLVLQHAPQGSSRDAIAVSFGIDRKVVSERRFTVPGQYFMEADLRALQGRRCTIELRSDSFFIPRFIHNVPDDRQLSIQLMETRVEPVQEEIPGRDENEGWIGRSYRQELLVAESGSRLEITLQHSPPPEKGTSSTETTVYLNQDAVTSRHFTNPGRYLLDVDIEKFRGRSVVLELRSQNSATCNASASQESRPRSIKLVSAQVDDTESGFKGIYEGDSYIGPNYCQELLIPRDASRLVMVLKHTHQCDAYKSVSVSLLLNHAAVANVECTEPGEYTLAVDVRKFQGQSCVIELRSTHYFVPKLVHRVPDDRRLSIQLTATRLELEKSIPPT